MSLHDYALHYGEGEATVAPLPSVGITAFRQRTVSIDRDTLTLVQAVER